MATRSSSSSTSALLIILLLVFTFPIWIAVFGALIGVIGGVFGVVIGIIAAIFGVAVTIITLPFRILFGWGDGDWGWHGFPHFELNGYVVLVIVILVFLFYRKR
jgi:hypothetical protein